MQDLTKGLLNLNITPEQGRLLDRQAREQQIQQQASRAPAPFQGMMAQTRRTADTLRNVGRAAFGGRGPVGPAEPQARQAQKMQQDKQAQQQKNLQLLKQQAEVAVDNSGLPDVQKVNLKKMISLDPTGERSNQVVAKYGMPDVATQSDERNLGFSTANVGGKLYSFNKNNGEYTLIDAGTDDPSQNSKSSPQTAKELDGLAEDAIKAMLTDKSSDPRRRAILSQAQAKFRKENPEAGVRELHAHLAGISLEQEDLADAEEAYKARKQMNTDIIMTLDTINVIAENAEDVGELEYLFAQYIPGTKSKDIKVNLQNLFAKISFDRLTRMRNESKTGGALGNVSNFEIGLLQNSLKALDPEAPSFKDNLNKIKQHYETIMMLYAGNEEQAMEFIDTNPNYVVTDKGAIYHKADEDSKPRLVGNLGG